MIRERNPRRKEKKRMDKPERERESGWRNRERKREVGGGYDEE